MAITSKSHPPYQDMVREAIVDAKEKSGLSRMVIKRFILAQYPGISPGTAFDALVNSAIKRGAEKGTFEMPNGASGKVKLAAAVAKPVQGSIGKGEVGGRRSPLKRGETAVEEKGAKKASAAPAKKVSAKKSAVVNATKSESADTPTRATRATRSSPTKESDAPHPAPKAKAVLKAKVPAKSPAKSPVKSAVKAKSPIKAPAKAKSPVKAPAKAKAKVAAAKPTVAAAKKVAPKKVVAAKSLPKRAAAVKASKVAEIKGKTVAVKSVR